LAIIEVNNIVKDFRVVKKESGIKGALKNIIKSNKSILRAVDDISFSIEKGEIVGYIGPNGAGKSTTVKIMSGILQPTSGSVLIDGLSPYTDRIKVVRNLGVVFGQRSQLYWDLRLGESFELLKRIYQIEAETYKNNLRMLNDVLNIQEIIDTPVRQLSLGQRMRGDLAAAILHSPSIIFLDEPTIGLDVEVKYSVRKFIKDINEKYKTTIILTTHDLDDIQQLCDRVIIINNGKIVEDGSLNQLVDRIAPTKKIVVDFYEVPAAIQIDKAEIVKRDQARVWFEYDKAKACAGEILKQISEQYMIRDISFEEANIEDVIRRVYVEFK
jgi:ABC-2 type transport system ATP-binding protein